MFKLFTINKDILFYSKYRVNVDTSTVYRELKCDLLRAFRKLHLKSRLPLYHLWYTKEFRSAGGSSEVILFDSILTVPAANYLKRKFPNTRVIYWFWNHIYNGAVYKDLDPTIEQWSYDRDDCAKYKLKYNSQFYFKEFIDPQQSDIKHDFFFIGAEKGRAKDIEQCKDMIDRGGYTKRFVVIGNSREDRARQWMPYEQVVENIKSSRCVVDIVTPAQKGLTLRPLEALFMRKKLITNFVDIKDYDFYNPDNIFILGVDSQEQLDKFIYSPYNHEVDRYIDKYDFGSWLGRFSHI